MRTLGDWLKRYAESCADTEYVTYPGEQMVFHPEHGFFTFIFDAEERVLLIPKMCGDGRYWRKTIHEMVAATRHLGTRGVYCCTKRSPGAFTRLFGGEVVKTETREDGTVLSYIFITPENSKEKGGD